jgi:hypothetical protein
MYLLKKDSKGKWHTTEEHLGTCDSVTFGHSGTLRWKKAGHFLQNVKYQYSSWRYLLVSTDDQSPPSPLYDVGGDEGLIQVRVADILHHRQHTLFHERLSWSGPAGWWRWATSWILKFESWKVFDVTKKMLLIGQTWLEARIHTSVGMIPRTCFFLWGMLINGDQAWIEVNSGTLGTE